MFTFGKSEKVISIFNLKIFMHDIFYEHMSFIKYSILLEINKN